MDVRTKLAKRAAEKGWTVKATEGQVAKVLAKAGKGRDKSAMKAPTQQYEYNGFRCALVGEEVVIGGRNFKRTKDQVRQFVAEYQSALECFLRDIDATSAEQPVAEANHLEDQASPTNAEASLVSAEVLPTHEMPTSEAAADLMKQAAEVAAAGQSLKDIFSEIAKAVGRAANENKGGNASLSDLLTLFNKPRSSG